MIREKNKLKQKQSTTNQAKNVQDLYYDSEDDDLDSDESASAQKKQAVAQIREELSEDSQSDDDEDQDSSQESQNGEIEVNFDKKAKVKKASKSKSDIEAAGIQNMKFMKNAESTKKDRLKNDAKMLIEQIQEDEELQNQDSDSNNQ